ncbi:MAG: DegT/DnrJ/EryC1/StrS family aminotransferase [Planctomycetota bacterium]|nr:DegT/DnrJ/EryC1/StrS family aminotransferase [Planctomycetota bacterium]
MASHTTTSSTDSGLKPLAPVDLAAERAALGPALEAKILEVLRSGTYILGPEVEKLERDMAAMHGVPYGVGVANGTDALVIALRAACVRPGDHVVTSPFTFFASAGSIAWMGARPVFADVDLDTALLSPTLAKRAIDAQTTAILPVHLYGQMADMKAFRAICDEKKLALVEDAAQSHAAKRDGFFCGELGDACAFSFYPTKNLGACGEGGMIITKSEAVYQRAKRLREHGSSVRYTHTEIGTNSRLQAFQGGALNVKLPHLAAWTARRNQIAARYDAAFRGAGGIVPLTRLPNTTHVYHQYTIRVIDVPRDEMVERLKEKKIFVGVHYPSPVHLQEAARPWGYGPGDFPNAERLAREVVCLPVHPFLSDADADRIAENVIAFSRGTAGTRS